MARPLRFGISVVPTAATFDGIVEQVRAAEDGGLDLVGIQDHPYQRRFLDTFSLIALNLDPAILDGAAGAAALPELGSKLPQCLVVH